MSGPWSDPGTIAADFGAIVDGGGGGDGTIAGMLEAMAGDFPPMGRGAGPPS
ncbi:hypothetical protein [Tautonia plasticadhaerens]|uniref:Uncharacterized protein n=1 Tax=Tautonia plasticadhaerens TaxID=2527974 RepID=A0A518GVX0_9BACT|nr:hypothetical protein [Tautonia plasticadhaerens]QDV32743.1 hypothetical protein ElP_05830 [Tautonia plasticadhaerens]